MRKNRLKDFFLIFSYGGYFCNRPERFEQVFGRELYRKSSVKWFKSDQRFKRIRRLKDILFLVLGAILFNGPVQSEKFS